VFKDIDLEGGIFGKIKMWAALKDNIILFREAVKNKKIRYSESLEKTLLNT